MGERHFTIMSAGSRQEAREQAIKATMVLLLGEDEMQMREEERQMREEERQMREEERQMREEERQMREEERQSAQVHTHARALTHSHTFTHTHTHIHLHVISDVHSRPAAVPPPYTRLLR